MSKSRHGLKNLFDNLFHIFPDIQFLCYLLYVKLSCRSINVSRIRFTGICPGAEARIPAANVTADPVTSPQSLLSTPVFPIDMVITGFSVSFFIFTVA